MSASPPTFTRSFLLLFSGAIVWSVHFVAIYGFTGVMCARPALRQEWLGIGIIAWGVSLASLMAIAILVVLHFASWRAWRQGHDISFQRKTAASLALFAILAIVWETLPVLLVPACG